MAVCGGWHASGLAPLADLAVFDLQRCSWLDLSGGIGSSGGGSSSACNRSTGSAGSPDASSNGAAEFNVNGADGSANGSGQAPADVRPTSLGPCARGQPSLAARTDGTAMLLFGG